MDIDFEEGTLEDLTVGCRVFELEIAANNVLSTRANGFAETTAATKRDQNG